MWATHGPSGSPMCCIVMNKWLSRSATTCVHASINCKSVTMLSRSMRLSMEHCLCSCTDDLQDLLTILSHVLRPGMEYTLYSCIYEFLDLLTWLYTAAFAGDTQVFIPDLRTGTPCNYGLLLALGMHGFERYCTMLRLAGDVEAVGLQVTW